MSNKTYDSAETGKGAAQQKSERKVLNMIDWFLDSVIYDLVTWVAIAFSIGLTLVYLFAVNPRNWRGVFWSFILLAIFASIMIAVRVDQRYFRKETVLPKGEAAAVSATVSAADRPWLSIDTIPNGPLTFKDNNANLAVRFIVRNTGRSAANRATINFKVIAPKLGPDQNMYKEAINRQKEICGKAQPNIMPRTVFPGDAYAVDWTFSMGRQEVELNAIEGTKIIALFIVGCVDYGYADDPPTYQTGFVREVHKFTPETPGARLGLSLDEDVPANRLVFDVSVFGGDYAH